MQHPRTERALKAIEALVKEGVIKTQKELCKSIDYDYSNYSQIKNGKRDLPEKNIENLVKAYGVSLDYIKFGKGPMLLGLPNIKDSKRVAVSEDDVFRLQVQMDLLRDQVKELEHRLSVQEYRVSELKTVTYKKSVEKKVQGK